MLRSAQTVRPRPRKSPSEELQAWPVRNTSLSGLQIADLLLKRALAQEPVQPAW